MELCSLLVGSLHYFAGLMADWPGRFLGQKMTIGKCKGWPANPYIAAKGVPSFCNMSYSYHLALTETFRASGKLNKEGNG